MIIKKFSWQLRAFCAAGYALFLSCTPESVDPPTCIDGNCDAVFNLPYFKDKNGYFHVDLDFTQQYYPRFSIEIDASTTNPEYWYNNSPVVYSNFETDTYWNYNTDRLPIVQGTKIYLSKYSNKRMKGKRIVGPIPPEFEGDTILIYPRVFWDSGLNSIEKNFSLKIIVK